MTTRLLFFSDFVCPFCYVAERGVLSKLVERLDLAFEWRGFQLHPSTPRGGTTIAKLLPGAPLEAMRARMQAFSASFGVKMRHPDRVPNTRRAIAVAEFARDAGRLAEFRYAAMEAHWNRDLDIEADAVLRDLAIEAGLDGAKALEAADSPVFQGRVDAMGREAVRWGVTGIPTYFLLPGNWNLGDPKPPADQPQPVRIVGCQPFDLVLAAATKAGAVARA